MPRMRSSPAMVPASDSATMARRIIFTARSVTAGRCGPDGQSGQRRGDRLQRGDEGSAFLLVEHGERRTNEVVGQLLRSLEPGVEFVGLEFGRVALGPAERPGHVGTVDEVRIAIIEEDQPLWLVFTYLC